MQTNRSFNLAVVHAVGTHRKNISAKLVFIMAAAVVPIIREQAKAGTELQAIYQEELAQINTRLKNMKVTCAALQAKVFETQQTTAVQQATLEELAVMSLEAFWKQESRYINQTLHRLLSKKRFMLLMEKA